jgi:long-chain fatty acid transport protein
MNNKAVHSSTLRAITAFLVLSAASQVRAGGPALSGLVAEASDAESVFTAPAAMARLEGTHLTVQGMAVASFTRFEIDEGETTIEGGDPDNGIDPIIIPSVYYVRELNDRWNAGLSLTVPTGFGSDYGGSWSGRYETVDFSLVYIALTPALSYRVNDKLSVGTSVGFNYTSSTSEQKIPQPLGERDGKLTSDLDGIGINVNLSLLYEFNPRTRAGISWTSDSDADLEGNVRLRNLGPVLDEIAGRTGIRNINTKITNTLPQRVLAGIYHEFDSGNYFTLDGLWMKFSDFSVTNLELEGEDVNIQVPEIYDDIWAVTAGYGWPVNSRTTYKLGAMYLSQAVDDEDRNFSMRLDAMWGIGAGMSYELTEERTVDLNFTLLNTGESPVDVESLGGRVSGESRDHYAGLVELTYHF